MEDRETGHTVSAINCYFMCEVGNLSTDRLACCLVLLGFHAPPHAYGGSCVGCCIRRMARCSSPKYCTPHTFTSRSRYEDTTFKDSRRMSNCWLMRTHRARGTPRFASVCANWQSRIRFAFRTGWRQKWMRFCGASIRTAFATSLLSSGRIWIW